MTKADKDEVSLDWFRDSICPDCGDYMEGRFSPCGLEESSDMSRYIKLVAEGKLLPA